MTIRINIPSPTTGEEDLDIFLDDVFQDITASFEEVADRLHEILSVAPAKPQVGMEAYADGVGWNPGSGEGLYLYKSTGWKFLG